MSHIADPDALAEIARLTTELANMRENVEALTDRQAQSRDSIVHLRDRVRQLRDERHALREEIEKRERKRLDTELRYMGLMEGTSYGVWVTLTALGLTPNAERPAADTAVRVRDLVKDG